MDKMFDLRSFDVKSNALSKCVMREAMGVHVCLCLVR